MGRLRGWRKMGKASFGVLEDDSGSTQIFLQRDVLGEAYDLVKQIDLGDFLEVSGTAMKTKTGEETVGASAIKIIAKALRPLPDQFHGLKDRELRYRHRELDLLANPEAKIMFRQRALLIRYLRDFFDAKDFLEVETPILQPLAGGTMAKPFMTHHEALDIDLFLRIAPELYLKRLVVGGFEKVYEIGKIFRNEGISPQHLQEFTELEFYQAYASHEDLMKLEEEMLTTVLKKVFDKLKFKFGDHEIDFTAPWKVVDYNELLKEHSGIDLDKIQNVEELSAAIKEKKIDVHLEKGMSLGHMIDNLYKVSARPTLINPTHVVGQPLVISPLAKKDAKRPDHVERFQTVVAGFEISNAYSELNDPQEQRRRFEEQASMRNAGDAEAHVKDEQFIESLEYGLPPTAGYGLGIDRVLAIVTNSSNVREVVLFPTMKPL